MLKMHLKYKKRKSIFTKILVIISSGIAFSFFIIYLINKTITPNLLSYAISEARSVATSVISKSVLEETKDSFTLENLIISEKNDDGEIISVEFNSYVLNSILVDVSDSVQVNLKRLESGDMGFEDMLQSDILKNRKNTKNGVIYEIPLGLALNNSLLSNIGPKIPIRLKLIGDIETSLESKITDYGINNALIEIIVSVIVTEQVILPIKTETVKIHNDVPVAIKVIKGEVPDYFSGSNNKLADFSIPIKQ